MKKLLSVLVAAAFAATSFGVVAQKDVTDKKGGTVTDKKGEAVTTKEMKDKPKHEKKARAPRAAAPAKPPKEKGEVKTKRNEAVTNKKGDEVKSGQK